MCIFAAMNENILPIHFAPLQGYTDAVYRRAHARIFGGIETYYSPFVRMEHGEIRRKDARDIEPDLEELKNRGKNIAVVSNKFYAATREICRHFFGDLVDVAIGERENIKKKPAPDTVNEALRQLHADRERAVYIGDSDVDVMTAKNSGMPCISVLWGFRDHDFLLAHGASILVSSPLQIL